MSRWASGELCGGEECRRARGWAAALEDWDGVCCLGLGRSGRLDCGVCGGAGSLCRRDLRDGGERALASGLEPGEERREICGVGGNPIHRAWGFGRRG